MVEGSAVPVAARFRRGFSKGAKDKKKAAKLSYAEGEALPVRLSYPAVGHSGGNSIDAGSSPLAPSLYFALSRNYRPMNNRPVAEVPFRTKSTS